MMIDDKMIDEKKAQKILNFFAWKMGFEGVSIIGPARPLLTADRENIGFIIMCNQSLENFWHVVSGITFKDVLKRVLESDFMMIDDKMMKIPHSLEEIRIMMDLEALEDV